METYEYRGFRSIWEIEDLVELGNSYVSARTIELSCLLDFLLHNGHINPANLDRTLYDLGTGSGVGLLALRKFSRGYLRGIDFTTQSRDGLERYSVPEPKIIGLAIADFEHSHIYSFLQSCPPCSASLITAFYSSVGMWQYQQPHSSWLTPSDFSGGIIPHVIGEVE